MLLSELEYAYLAGYTDGDGCFSVQASNQASGRYYNPRLSWDSTDRIVLEWIVERYGTKLWLTSNKTGRRPIYRTQLMGRNLFDAATGMLSFLVIKKYQAELSIQALDCKDVGFKKVICDHIQEANQRVNMAAHTIWGTDA